MCYSSAVIALLPVLLLRHFVPKHAMHAFSSLSPLLLLCCGKAAASPASFNGSRSGAPLDVYAPTLVPGNLDFGQSARLCALVELESLPMEACSWATCHV